MGGSTTISNSETRAEALKLQSSSYGVAKAVLHGTFRMQLNLLDFGDFTAIAHTETQQSGGKGGGGVRVQNTTYTYTASAVLGICRGVLKRTGWIWRGKEKWPAGEGPTAKRLTVFYGFLDQPVWDPLLTMHGGTHAQNYSGTALFCLQDYDLGSSATLENHNIEAMGPGSFDDGAKVPDANPAQVAYDYLFSPLLGLGLPLSLLGDLDVYRNYCYAAGLLLSPALTEQAPAADRFVQLGLLTNSTMLVVEGKLYGVPLGAEPLSRTYPGVEGIPGPGFFTIPYSYTPDNTPLYHLTPDHFLDRGADQPAVSVIRKSPADAFNIVEVEFRDRANDYAIGRASVKDQTSIDLYGAKPAPTIQAPWICDHETASRLAWLELQRHLQVLNEYEFDLPWNFAALLPKNILTLTEPEWELEQLPVRINTIKETVSGFSLVCEDFPGEVPAAPAYQLPGVDAFRQDYAAAPGDTTVAAVFEAPYELSGDTGLEVWLAVHGTAPGWGGCHVWVSADGVEYRRVDTQWGATRCGTMAGAVTASAITVDVADMTGALLSGSALDASVGATLCYVGGSSPEYLAYQTAALTGPGAYNLGNVVRGMYGSVARAHLTGSPFVRCDDALAKSGPLGLGMVGREIFIKCQSFNVFGLNEQDLADVTATAYTITGRFASPKVETVNLCTEGSFDLLPLGERPNTWDGGTVQAVTGQPFARALRFTLAMTSAAVVKIAAAPGERFHVAALLNGAASGGSTSVGLWFFDAADAAVSFVPASTSVSAGSGWAARAGVVQAPAGAAYALVALSRSGTLTGYAEATNIVVRRQAKTVETEEHMATDILSASSAGGVALASTLPIYFTPEVNCTALVEIEFAMTFDAGSMTNAWPKWTARPTLDRTVTPFGTLTPIGESIVIGETVPQWQVVNRSYSRTYEYQLEAGVAYSVRMNCSARSTTVGDPAFSELKLKMELIKR